MFTLSFTAVYAALLVDLLQVGVGEQLLAVITQLTPIEAAAIGGGGVVSVGTVRWLIKRASDGDRDTGSPTGTAVNTTATSTASTAGTSTTSTAAMSSAGKHKVAFTLPSFLPVSQGIREVTHNEIHALELGLVVGLAVTWLWNAGHQEPVLGLVFAFVAGSLGFKRYGSKAFKTIRLEPWYGLMALAGGAALGWALFIRDPGLLTLLGLA